VLPHVLSCNVNLNVSRQTVSIYQRHHSTKTALLIIHNVLTIEKAQQAALIILDLSCASDSVAHGFLDYYLICTNQFSVNASTAACVSLTVASVHIYRQSMFTTRTALICISTSLLLTQKMFKTCSIEIRSVTFPQTTNNLHEHFAMPKEQLVITDSQTKSLEWLSYTIRPRCASHLDQRDCSGSWAALRT